MFLYGYCLEKTNLIIFAEPVDQLSTFLESTESDGLFSELKGEGISPPVAEDT
jgi:hypothetical protein